MKIWICDYCGKEIKKDVQNHKAISKGKEYDFYYHKRCGQIVCNAVMTLLNGFKNRIEIKMTTTNKQK